MRLSNFPPDYNIELETCFMGGPLKGRLFPNFSTQALLFCTLSCFERVLKDLLYYEARGLFGSKWHEKIKTLNPPKTESSQKNVLKKAESIRIENFKKGVIPEDVNSSTSPISKLDFLLFGDILRIMQIKEIWTSLTCYLGDRDSFENQFIVLEKIRNAIAHGRNIKYLEIDRLKHTIEQFNMYFNNFRAKEKDAYLAFRKDNNKIVTGEYNNIFRAVWSETPKIFEAQRLAVRSISLRHHDFVALTLEDVYTGFDFEKLRKEDIDTLQKIATFSTITFRPKGSYDSEGAEINKAFSDIKVPDKFKKDYDELSNDYLPEPEESEEETIYFLIPHCEVGNENKTINKLVSILNYCIVNEDDNEFHEVHTSDLEQLPIAGNNFDHKQEDALTDLQDNIVFRFKSSLFFSWEKDIAPFPFAER